MEALLKLQPVNAMSNVKGIRAVLDNMEIQVRGLQALGIDSAQCGALLMEKLPEELRLTVSREHKDNWELTSELKAVKNEVEACERCGMNRGGTRVLFGWVCAARKSKLASRSKKNSLKLIPRSRNRPIFYTPS